MKFADTVFVTTGDAPAEKEQPSYVSTDEIADELRELASVSIQSVRERLLRAAARLDELEFDALCDAYGYHEVYD